VPASEEQRYDAGACQQDDRIDLRAVALAVVRLQGRGYRSAEAEPEPNRRIYAAFEQIRSSAPARSSSYRSPA
jgi:hypothetical protein